MAVVKSIGAQEIKANTFEKHDTLKSILVYDDTIKHYDVEFTEKVIDKAIVSRNCKDYNGIKVILLSDRLSKIGDTAFGNCINLEKVELSNSVTIIGKDAFRNCGQLFSVQLLDGVTKTPCNIEEGAFYNCTSLTNLTLSNHIGAIGVQSFYNCKELKKIECTDTLTKINKEAFLDCINLEEVEIGKSIVEIDDWAFYGCNSLKTVRIKAETPPTLGKDVFPNSNIDLEIPKGSRSSYEKACGMYNNVKLIEK